MGFAFHRERDWEQGPALRSLQAKVWQRKITEDDGSKAKEEKNMLSVEFHVQVGTSRVPKASQNRYARLRFEGGDIYCPDLQNPQQLCPTFSLLSYISSCPCP